jgi:hypothetical protein
LQPSKNPFVDTLRAVINDVKWFLFLLLLTMWGFCMAFYILFRRDQKKVVRCAVFFSSLYARGFYGVASFICWHVQSRQQARALELAGSTLQGYAFAHYN